MGACDRPLNHSGTHKPARTLAKETRDMQQRYAEARERINAYKLEQGCVDCGYNAHAVALDLDHTDRSAKKFTIAEVKVASWKRVLAEIEKCVVRCANCHRVKTSACEDYSLLLLSPLLAVTPQVKCVIANHLTHAKS